MLKAIEKLVKKYPNDFEVMEVAQIALKAYYIQVDPENCDECADCTLWTMRKASGKPREF